MRHNCRKYTQCFVCRLAAIADVMFVLGGVKGWCVLLLRQCISSRGQNPFLIDCGEIFRKLMGALGMRCNTFRPLCHTTARSAVTE